MTIKFSAARAVSATATWGLKHVFHRPAANFPGKVALYVDPQLIAHLRGRLQEGSVVVVGTNGKTTTTNLLANVIEASGRSVVCNRTGANLDSGVATSLLQTKGASWGVLESDELWMAKILPQLQPTYVLLLNLFRDQLDRCGEIDRIQESIIGALDAAPQTTLVYNADDPLCAYIASRVSNAKVAFGVAESMGLVQNTVSDAQMCQHCSTMFEYEFRQYGQLGKYRCPHCGFARPELDFSVCDVRFSDAGTSFVLASARDVAMTGVPTGEGAGAVATAGALAGKGARWEISSTLDGSYMVYNLAAAACVAQLVGCSLEALQASIDAFDPKNGRLQAYDIAGRHTLLNLAKNPTGFNQNLRIVARDSAPKAVAFFLNDKEADGHDISWIWDVDFEELAGKDCLVFVGGLRVRDLQVRLKYAGISARVIDSAREVFETLSCAQAFNNANVYLIANYTALPAVHDELDALSAAVPTIISDCNETATSTQTPAQTPTQDAPTIPNSTVDAPLASTPTPNPDAPSTSTRTSILIAPSTSQPPLVIAHLFPDLLNLYGDGGKVRILAQRAHWRGVPVEVKRATYGQTINLAEVDLVFLGGGPDREQRLASQELMRMRDDLRDFVEADGALLAICGGYQILGSKWLLGDEEVEGLSIVDLETRRAQNTKSRLIENIVLSSPLSAHPVVGYENHAGRTYLGASLEPFGKVISTVGAGNNEHDKADGVLYKHVLGTYLHGTLLSKNPEVADILLGWAAKRYASRTGFEFSALLPTPAPLDDTAELAANAHMCKRLGVS